MIVPYRDLVEGVFDGRRRIDALVQQFSEHYGTRPDVVVSAPGRTEIIGNHTDHNNGRVVAAAIEQDTLVVAAPAERTRETESGSASSALRLVSRGWDGEFRPGQGLQEARNDTERLMLGVQKGLEQSGIETPGYRACMESRVLPGSGLSSSAALEVALAGIHGVLAGLEVPPLQAAMAGRYAENHYMGKPSGLMDQLASALGGMQAIDFADPEAPLVHRIEVDFSESSHQLMVVHTGGSHADLTDSYASVSREMHAVARELGVTTLAETSRKDLFRNLTRVRSTVGDRAIMRALHFFEEQNRVSAFVDAADSRLNQELMELMVESGDSSIRLLQNVYTGSDRDQSLALGLELTRVYLRQRGATGAYRVHGGGFAGTMLAVIPDELVAEYRTAMQRAFGDHAVVPLDVRPHGLIAARIPQ